MRVLHIDRKKRCITEKEVDESTPDGAVYSLQSMIGGYSTTDFRFIETASSGVFLVVDAAPKLRSKRFSPWIFQGPEGPVLIRSNAVVCSADDTKEILYGTSVLVDDIKPFIKFDTVPMTSMLSMTCHKYNLNDAWCVTINAKCDKCGTLIVGTTGKVLDRNARQPDEVGITVSFDEVVLRCELETCCAIYRVA